MNRRPQGEDHPRRDPHSHFAAQVEAKVLTTVMMAVSGAIALVALSYATYAQISTF